MDSKSTFTMKSETYTIGKPKTDRPCAACKHLRRKCRPECIFHPYFPGDQPHLVFENARRVFTAGRIRKMLESAPPEQREDAARAIIYESCIRAKSPIHGSYGVVLELQNRIKLLSDELRQYRTPVTSPNPAAVPSVACFSPGSRGTPPSTVHITLNKNHYFPNANDYFSGGGYGVPFGIPNANANAFVCGNANVSDGNGNASSSGGGNQAFGVSTPNNDDCETQFGGNQAQLLTFLKRSGYKVESAAKSTPKDDEDSAFMY